MIIRLECVRSLWSACPKKTSKKHKVSFDKDCALLRKNLRILSNKKQKNPYDTNLRHNYHNVRKNFKKLVKNKKAKLLNSQVEDLVQNKDSHKFWTYLKSLKEGQCPPPNKSDIPVDNLFRHFESLHSDPDLSSFSRDSMSSIKEDLSNLEETKEIHNLLDSSIAINEIETMVKSLKVIP